MRRREGLCEPRKHFSQSMNMFLSSFAPSAGSLVESSWLYRCFFRIRIVRCGALVRQSICPVIAGFVPLLNNAGAPCEKQRNENFGKSVSRTLCGLKWTLDASPSPSVGSVIDVHPCHFSTIPKITLDDWEFQLRQHRPRVSPATSIAPSASSLAIPARKKRIPGEQELVDHLFAESLAVV